MSNKHRYDWLCLDFRGEKIIDDQTCPMIKPNGKVASSCHLLKEGNIYNNDMNCD
jgi:hypothetical protein